MAEQITQDVVKEAQSMGDASPIDATATTTNDSAGDGEVLSESTTAIPKSSEVSLTSSPNDLSTNEPEIGVTSSSTNKANDDSLAPAIIDAEEPQYNASRSKVLEELIVNGDAGEHSAAEDAVGQTASVETSGGSDTDISRPGSVDQTKERPGRHIRSNSAKKLASFKAVSVTKNFLAKSAVSTPSMRPGEKVFPAGQTNPLAQPALKPRLVAKSGSGLGTVPRSSLSKLNGAGSGPDASKVWNKNQPVPPPPPKQFTDEELKQQYGIHLATRLQADESGKEAKWADIDDDEDDWAPETVEWMDGTKSTVAATENQTLPDEPKPTTETETPTEAGKPVLASSSSLQRPSSASGTKTILKPGIHTLTSSKAGLVLKGGPEKQTLVAKPSAPAPVKSPWAQLPPVDKVSPVQINPPAQPPAPTRFSQRDPHGFDALPPAPASAREFAPDDLNRSWRDDRGNKELFNPHNGRYEPVNDMRRGSFRDNNFRQPSVLQRPSQQGGPAEPSAAFQTSRSSAAEGPSWGRRRNSSNVSGGSGRRMSFGRLPDIPPVPLDMQHRRGSQSLTSSEIATPTETPRAGLPQNRAHFPERGVSPADQNHSWTQKSSPNASYAQPASPYGSVGSSGVGEIAQGAMLPMEDAVERQKRLMREKLERAKLEKQRQQEEEAKQEAAKKERLRLKLEAMGVHGDHKNKVKNASPPLPTEKSPKRDKAIPAPIQSPPKPPVPTSEGEIAQYGLIKVHQPHPYKKPGNFVEIPLPEPKLSPKPAEAAQEVAPKSTPSPMKLASVGVQPKSSPFIESHSHTVDQPPQLEQSKSQQSEAEVRAPSYKSLDRSSQAWKSSIPHQESYPTWSSSISNNQASGNVWGPPQYKDRALGNGTFDANYNRGPTRPASHQPQQPHTNQPGPIAPPSTIKLSPAQTQAVPNHTPVFNHTQIFMPPADMRQQQSTALADMSHNTINTATSLDPGPIAPPTKTVSSAPKGEWGNFSNAIQRDDAMCAAKWREECEKSGAATYMPQIKETFRLTKPAEDGISRRKVLKTNSVVHVAQGGNINETTSNHQSEGASSRVDSAEPVPKVETSAATQPDSHSSQPAVHVDNLASHQPVGATANLNVPHAQGGRSSRFFPRASETASQASTTSQQSDSPPPPETYSHPAFDGDANHPVVNLPVPKARVKLPPVPPSPPAPVIMPVRPEQVIRIGSQPLVTQKDWQARFNGLFGRTTQPQPQAQNAHPVASPPAPISLAVTSASKAPLDVTTQRNSATVSLPIMLPKKAFANFNVDDSDDIMSKVTAEEALLEDREFGSLPTINLPKKPHLAANEPPIPPPSTRPNSKFQRPVETVSATSLPMNPADSEVNIRLPGAKETIKKTMSKPRARKTTPYSNNNNNNKKRNFTPREGNNSPNPRPRKPSSNYQTQTGPSQNTTPRPSPSGAGWNNSNVRASSQQNNAWNKRTAPGVVH